MSNFLRIVEPMAFTSSGAFTGASSLSNPDPREGAVYTAGGTGTINIDLGAVRPVDTILVGYTNDSPSGTLRIACNNASAQVVNQVVTAAPGATGFAQHFLLELATPVAMRYVNVISTAGYPAGYAVGMVAIGRSFQATYGQEVGAGRPLDDTSGVERLAGGGFAIDPGAVIAGYQWTFGDLQKAERQQLYGIAKRLGQSRPVLVVEPDDDNSDLNERIHWGLFRKLETYERVDPVNWRWNLSVWDWL